MKIMYMPAYAKTYAYIIAKNIDGQWYYHGASDDANKANESALMLKAQGTDAVVLPTASL